jgi:hypothetical protein
VLPFARENKSFFATQTKRQKEKKKKKKKKKIFFSPMLMVA